MIAFSDGRPKVNHSPGADPGFSFRGGGAQKIMCPHAHYDRKTELTFSRGPGPLKGPGPCCINFKIKAKSEKSNLTLKNQT